MENCFHGHCEPMTLIQWLHQDGGFVCITCDFDGYRIGLEEIATGMCFGGYVMDVMKQPSQRTNKLFIGL